MFDMLRNMIYHVFMDGVNNMAKTKDYVLRAHNKYIHTKDRMTILADPGTVDKINDIYGEKGHLNEYVNSLIRADFERRGIKDQAEDPGDWLEEAEKQDQKNKNN